MPKPKGLLTNLALLAAVLGLAGCNTPSMEDFQRVENEVTELRARVEAAEAQADESSLSADSALDSAGQCNQVCGLVSDRLDELYLEIMPR